MSEPRPRERELVLAPNEYAYVLDTTKGHINCYVGPNKTSLAQTDELVTFNPRSKRFEHVEMNRAISLFATAPANWYVQLKNPAKDNVHPSLATSNASVDLEIGEKINVPGPTSFPLWPGQFARVVEGHRLRSNEYLYVRIYDADAAAENWSDAFGEEEARPVFSTGQKLVIRGTDVSFFIPPTGVEVLPDSSGNHVRRAATLQRLQYCILAGEDGRKTYVRGEAVVFPEPDQHFVERDRRSVFRAIELSEITGIYVKVIAPYTDEDGEAHLEGEELFLTGKNVIYFPREEHAIIRYGEREIHQALAIPKGEGRYVLNRLTGDVRLARGPCMLLPDPRVEVLTRRVLTEAERRLYFPTLRSDAQPAVELIEPEDSEEPAAEGFVRPVRFSPPRTITLDSRSEGAVSVDVTSGHAVQVVNRSGDRRVVPGPASVMLEYDESLEILRLSTGTPKSDERRLDTVFLRIHGNKVSDAFEIRSLDAVRCAVRLEYRVSFEGDDPSRWFRVDDYVKLLTDHASSMIKAAARKRSIRELTRDVAEIVRDALLGLRDESGRVGLVFSENGMCVFDVEVLDLDLLDDDVDELLSCAQSEALAHAVQVAEKEGRLDGERRLEELTREATREAQATRLHRLALDEEVQLEAHRAREREMERRAQIGELERKLQLETALAERKIEDMRHVAELKRERDLSKLRLEELSAHVDGTVRQAAAFTPQLVSALHRMGDQELLSSLAGNFGELAAIEGRGILDVAQKFLDFIPSSMVPQLSAPKNGKPD